MLRRVSFFICPLILLCFTIKAKDFDKYSLEGFTQDARKDDLKSKMYFSSGKKSDVRYYRAQVTQSFDSPIAQLLDITLNYKLRCNNDLNKYRTLTPKDYKCPYPSKSIIETQIVPNSKSLEKVDNEIKSFFVQSRMKRRGDHSHVDLVRIIKISEDEYIATQEMLTEERARKYLKSPVPRKSVFTVSKTIFRFKKINDKKTELYYEYLNKTDHWLLNKSITTSTVFDSMTASIQRVFNTIEAEVR